jgi:hypothetical protein
MVRSVNLNFAASPPPAKVAEKIPERDFKQLEQSNKSRPPNCPCQEKSRLINCPVQKNPDSQPSSSEKSRLINCPVQRIPD